MTASQADPMTLELEDVLSDAVARGLPWGETYTLSDGTTTVTGPIGETRRDTTAEVVAYAAEADAFRDPARPNMRWVHLVDGLTIYTFVVKSEDPAAAAGRAALKSIAERQLRARVRCSAGHDFSAAMSSHLATASSLKAGRVVQECQNVDCTAVRVTFANGRVVVAE